MVSLKPIFSQNLSLFRTQNPLQFLKSLNLNPFLEQDSVSAFSQSRLNLSPISLRPFSSSPKFKARIISKLDKTEKKPLAAFFKEAVGLVEKSEDLEKYYGGEHWELKKRLKKLEDGVRLKMEEKRGNGESKKPGSLFKLFVGNQGVDEDDGGMEEKVGKGKDDLGKESKQRSLSGLFGSKESRDGVNLIKVDHRMEGPGLHKEEIGNGKEGGSVNESKQGSLSGLFARKEENKDGENLGEVDHRMEDSRVHKELSPDMIMFVTHLYKEGYFKDSNFLPRDKFAIGCFENSYARNFVKFAAEQFGRDNQEIAEQLSARDLKKVALFGCPSLARKNVFSAKRMRTFFKIQETTVCDRCVLKKSCEFVNQSVWKGDAKALNLADIMRVITLYALESVPSVLVVPEGIKLSVGKLLMEAINLSVKKIS